MNTSEQIFHTLVKYVEGELGDIARDYFLGIHAENTQKHDGTVVTEVDAIIEKKLKLFIKNNFPEDAIYGEEEGFVPGTSEFVWVIDPIDGTDNFVRKIPFFGITVARLGKGGEGTFSIIYNPASRQTFSAFEGKQLCENGVPCVAVKGQVAGRNFVTVTGANSSAPWIKMARQNLQKGLYKEFGKSGHYHSSLLEHAYVATGKLEGLLQIEMNAWDSAAGVYLVLAGGGAVSVFSEGVWVKHTGPIQDLYGTDFSIKPTLFVSYQDIHERALAFIGDPKDWEEQRG
jgi:myo-inositol-1(or 4)-monophosphatase